MKRFILLAAVLAVCAPFATAQSRFDLHEVRWTLRPDPSGESIAMSMRLAPLHERERLVLRLPLWRPGSYRYASYERRLSGLRAVDQDGVERAILSLDPRTWEVDTRGAAALTVTYACDSDNEAESGATPAVHLHAPSVFLYADDTLPLSQSLRFELPPGWDVASGHRPDPLEPGAVRAPDYDVLVDCPILLGELERSTFTSHGKPFEVVLAGKRPGADQFSREEWLRKLSAIVDAAYDVVGDFPFERYVFLFVFSDIGGGYGLEHLNSTTIEFNHQAVRSGQLEGLESVTAHEFFHLWNVKRIRPQPLGPFDYSSDVRTKDLWWLEGVTSYYADVILQRAGLRGPDGDWFYAAQAGNFRNLRQEPGYLQLSPERASWTVWEEDAHPYISYYDQGQALGLALDLQIRIHTQNRRSLDDVVRFLHRWVRYPEPGYREGDLERAIHAVTGWDCAAFFDRHVSGLLDLPWGEIAPAAGLSLVDRTAGEPYLGFGMDDEQRLRVGSEGVMFDAGLRDGDRLRRLAGVDIEDRADLRRVLGTLTPSAGADVVVERDGAVLELSVPVRERTQHLFQLSADPAAPPECRAIAEGVVRGIPAGV
ncbi:MAG: M61 family peptidase [Planctomycetota bacterium]|nr:MAG: M61 family peptidase [Planctomycetota bacterium]